MPEVIFNGPEGRLEGRFEQNQNKSAPIALILHPHPKQGGTMNNKVVYHSYQSFVKLGFSTLRFNFRGVGKSEGKYDDGVGELADAASALDWLQYDAIASRKVWVAGFSFGAWIALQLLMRRPEIEGFIAISPPANKYDFTFLAPCPTSGLIIQGDQDDIVDEESVFTLRTKLDSQKLITVDYKKISGAGHFFSSEFSEIQESIEKYVTKRRNTSKSRSTN